MPKVFTSETQKIGETGENVACRFLMKHGFSILDRNYTKKWGELDIVAEKENKLYFIEVKSVSCETLPREISNKSQFCREKAPSDNVNRETYKSTSPGPLSTERTGSPCPREGGSWRPEDNMHPWKLKRLSRVIQTYLLSKKIPDEKEWQLDLLIVYLDLNNKKAKVKVVKDIIL